jgi:hypothetical protein
MTYLVFKGSQDDLRTAGNANIPVLLYGRRPPFARTACVGGPVLKEVRRLGVSVSQRTFDFLTIAMAVTAADTFVDRRTAADGWARELDLDIPLFDPSPWQAVTSLLAKALGFLSGDQWSLNFVSGGPERPTPQLRGSRRMSLADHDCVSLFSGGLDSCVGVLDLLAAGRRPLLVSHSYGGDAIRQRRIWAQLPETLSRFAAVANPRSMTEGSRDVQMRTRSFNFLAYGAVVATALADQHIAASPVSLFVPDTA